MKLPHYLRALRHRNYRWYFFGQMAGQPGAWMQQVAIGWLTYRLTQSVFMLGVVAFAMQIPVLFLGPVGGLLVDRLDRRRLLITVQWVALSLAVLLATLTLTNVIQSAHLVAIALAMGVITAVDTPARQAFTVRMVGNPADLPNGIALNGLSFNVARMIGPAIGGVVVSWAGEGVCFAIAASTYLLMIVALFMVKEPQGQARGAAGRGGIAAGVRLAWHSPGIRAILLVTAAVSFAAAPYMVVLPYFARDVYHGNADTLGFLLSCSGVGAISASIWVISRRHVHGLPRGVARAVRLGGFALAVFALMPGPWAAAPALAVLGGCFLISGIGCNTLLQTIVRDDMRGRLMSLFTMCLLGVMPLGSLLVSALGDLVGVQVTLVLCGLATTAAGMVFARNLHHIKAALPG